jgi:hypothetical protein
MQLPAQSGEAVSLGQRAAEGLPAATAVVLCIHVEVRTNLIKRRAATNGLNDEESEWEREWFYVLVCKYHQ